MIRCELIGKDTSVCVRFFTDDSAALKPWIAKFDSAPCHVHSDYDGNHSNVESEIKTWLGSSSCVSAVMLIDARIKHVSDPSFLSVCAKAKKLGVFTGLFIDGDKAIALIKSLQPNWVLSMHASPEVIEGKVNEILGVVRFTVFTKDSAKETRKPDAG